MKKAFIFDLDGTIVDSLSSIADCANDCIEEVGLPRQPLVDYRYFAGDGQYELIKRALRAAGDEELVHYEQAMSRYIEQFKERCFVGCKPYDGMEETLWKLKEKGFLLMVLSNKAHANTLRVVKEIYGEELFDHVQGQQESVPKKPDPAGVFMILNQYGLKPEECFYVGDTSVDMKTGNAAGVDTIGVTWGFRDREELEEYQANYIVNRPEELLNLI